MASGVDWDNDESVAVYAALIAGLAMLAEGDEFAAPLISAIVKMEKAAGWDRTTVRNIRVNALAEWRRHREA